MLKYVFPSGFQQCRYCSVDIVRVMSTSIHMWGTAHMYEYLPGTQYLGGWRISDRKLDHILESDHNPARKHLATRGQMQSLDSSIFTVRIAIANGSFLHSVNVVVAHLDPFFVNEDFSIWFFLRHPDLPMGFKEICESDCKVPWVKYYSGLYFFSHFKIKPDFN